MTYFVSDNVMREASEDPTSRQVAIATGAVASSLVVSKSQLASFSVIACVFFDCGVGPNPQPYPLFLRFPKSPVQLPTQCLAKRRVNGTANGVNHLLMKFVIRQRNVQ